MNIDEFSYNFSLTAKLFADDICFSFSLFLCCIRLNFTLIVIYQWKMGKSYQSKMVFIPDIFKQTRENILYFIVFNYLL